MSETLEIWLRAVSEPMIVIIDTIAWLAIVFDTRL